MYTFEEIKGHVHIVNNLQASIHHNKLSHAYIIDGAMGSGKKLLAGTIAKTLQCLKEGITPCCECISCKSFDSFNHPDVIYVKPTKTKSIGIDDIRTQISSILELKPYKYKYKIFIIEDADTMTVQAQNAILKTIEEPPSYAVFLLLSTHFNSFLQTILSRCVVIKLKPLGENIIKKYIMDHFSSDENMAKLYSVFSRGSIGQAEKIAASQEFINTRQEIIDLLTTIKDKDVISVFEVSKPLEAYKEDFDRILDIFYMWYRDIMILKSTENDRYIIQKDQMDHLKVSADKLSFENIFNAIDVIEQTRYKLGKNANFTLAVELMLLKLNRV